MKLRCLIYLTVLTINTVVSNPTSASEILLPTPSFDDAMTHIDSPKSLVNFLRENFEFEEDKTLFNTKDYWQSPQEFWAKKAGDCEDYALFAQYALSQRGYDAYVVSYYGHKGLAHTVTIYEENGRYNVINQDKLYKFQARTVEEALTKVSKRWTWGAVAEQHGTRGWMLQELVNPSYKHNFSAQTKDLKPQVKITF